MDGASGPGVGSVVMDVQEGGLVGMVMLRWVGVGLGIVTEGAVDAQEDKMTTRMRKMGRHILDETEDRDERKWFISFIVLQLVEVVQMRSSMRWC